MSLASFKPFITTKTPAVPMKLLASLLVAALMNGCATQNASNNTSTNSGTPSMHRTIAERISDEFIERTSHKNLAGINGVSENNVRIAINSFRREVLLTGEVPSEQIKAEISAMVGSINDVKQVYNNLTVTATPKAQSHTVHENYLKSKILAKIARTGGVKSSQYKLVVRDNMAYLLGFLTAEQEQTVVNAIASVQGMEGVKVLSTRVGGDTSMYAMAGGYADEDAETEGMVYGGSPSAVYPNTTYPNTAMPSTTYPQSMYLNTTPMMNYTNPNNTGAYTPTTPTYPNTYPNTYPSGQAAGYNPNAPVVKMEGSPTSSYVNLYNNTSKP